MARPTNDKKENNLILRVNSGTRKEIEKKARENGLSLSEYMRQILCEAGNINGYEELMEGMPYSCLKELSEMCDMTGGSLGIMMYDLYTRLKEGELDMDEGKIL